MMLLGKSALRCREIRHFDRFIVSKGRLQLLIIISTCVDDVGGEPLNRARVETELRHSRCLVECIIPAVLRR